MLTILTLATLLTIAALVVIVPRIERRSDIRRRLMQR